MGALSATPAPKYQKPFVPLVPGFVHAKFNDIKGIEGYDLIIGAISSINDKTCLVMVEPIQGEGKSCRLIIKEGYILLRLNS
jgi:acetylornithine aminotransferase